MNSRGHVCQLAGSRLELGMIRSIVGILCVEGQGASPRKSESVAWDLPSEIRGLTPWCPSMNGGARPFRPAGQARTADKNFCAIFTFCTTYRWRETSVLQQGGPRRPARRGLGANETSPRPLLQNGEPRRLPCQTKPIREDVGRGRPTYEEPNARNKANSEGVWSVEFEV